MLSHHADARFPETQVRQKWLEFDDAFVLLPMAVEVLLAFKTFITGHILQ